MVSVNAITVLFVVYFPLQGSAGFISTRLADRLRNDFETLVSSNNTEILRASGLDLLENLLHEQEEPTKPAPESLSPRITESTTESSTGRPGDNAVIYNELTDPRDNLERRSSSTSASRRTAPSSTESPSASRRTASIPSSTESPSASRRPAPSSTESPSASRRTAPSSTESPSASRRTAPSSTESPSASRRTAPSSTESPSASTLLIMSEIAEHDRDDTQEAMTHPSKVEQSTETDLSSDDFTRTGSPDIITPSVITSSTTHVLRTTENPTTAVPSERSSSRREVTTPSISTSSTASQNEPIRGDTRDDAQEWNESLHGDGKDGILLEMRFNVKKLLHLLSVTNEEYLTLDVKAPSEYSVQSEVSF